MSVTAPPVLSPAEIARFHADGYLRFRQVLEPARVEELRGELERLTREELAREDFSDLPPEFAYGHARRGASAGQRRAIHQFVNMWKVSPVFRRVLEHPEIAGAVRQLMGVEHVRLWHDQVISKPPGDNEHFRCHHDFYFWPLDHPRMITCWLALDDATPENGCMHVSPGSHRDPRLQPPGCELLPEWNLAPAPRGPGAPGSLMEEARGWGPEHTVPVPLRAGECMFHHCLNYHLTPRNITDRQRRAFVLIFMPEGTRYHHAQSPAHPCTSYLGLAEGALLEGIHFPRCGEGPVDAPTYPLPGTVPG
jgi:phytanoyl-CoA hydroxylase